MPTGWGFQIPGDLALSADGTQFKIVSGAELAEQEIRNAVQVWKGSWKYAPEEGLPMIDEISLAGPDLRVINQIFRELLQSCGGVLSVETVNSVFDRTSRNLTVTFALTADDGSTLADSVSVGLGE